MAQTEPFYEDNDYKCIYHKDEIFKPLNKMWCGGGCMPHKKVELEGIFFTTSDFLGTFVDLILTLEKYMLWCQEK